VYTCMHWVGTIVVAVIAALRHATPPTASPRLACRSPSILNPQSHEQVVLSIRFVASFHPPFTRFGQILTFPAYTTTPSPSQYPLVTQHIDLFRTHHPIPSRSTRQSTMPRWIPISLSIFPTSSTPSAQSSRADSSLTSPPDPTDTLSASDQTLENQNDEELNSLHGKIKSLRSVSRGAVS
jgi:hypothetical protein